MTQGGPLSAKLFNIIIDAVVREWLRLMRETLDNSGGYLTDQIEALFAIFYVDDGYIASRDAEFLQEALNILVETFKRVSLATNTKKTQAMVCTPGEDKGPTPNGFVQTPEGRSCCRGRVDTSSCLPCVRKDPPSPESPITP